MGRSKGAMGLPMREKTDKKTAKKGVLNIHHTLRGCNNSQSINGGRHTVSGLRTLLLLTIGVVGAINFNSCTLCSSPITALSLEGTGKGEASPGCIRPTVRPELKVGDELGWQLVNSQLTIDYHIYKIYQIYQIYHINSSNAYPFVFLFFRYTNYRPITFFCVELNCLSSIMKSESEPDYAYERKDYRLCEAFSFFSSFVLLFHDHTSFTCFPLESVGDIYSFYNPFKNESVFNYTYEWKRNKICEFFPFFPFV